MIPRGTIVIAVHEDWEGGAGNGLGTLYALVKAERVMQTTHERSLMAELKSKKIYK